jgi:hypothetical protein
LNLLNTSLGAWRRYFGFLQIISNRYLEATVPYVEGIQREMAAIQAKARGNSQLMAIPCTPEDLAEAQRLAGLAAAIHLDIESFFVFANILLDRVASTCRYYFWKRADWNHRQLMDSFENISRRKGLRLPDPDLLKMPCNLHGRIVSYRNTRVEHVEEPRVLFGTMWGLDKKARIAPSIIYPVGDEAKTAQEPTGDIEEIMALLDQYLTAILDFFEANADKSILPHSEPTLGK